MASLVFVHGIGVRNQGYPGVWPHLRDRLRTLRPAWQHDLCYWGGQHGARIQETVETADAAPTDEDQIQQWSALFNDPFWELRVLLEDARRHPFGARVPGQAAVGPVIRKRLEQVAADPPDELAAACAATGLAGHLAEAIDEALAVTEVDEALRLAEAIGPGIRAALARAVVAAAVVRAEPVLVGEDLDRLYALTVTAFGGTPMAVPNWLLSFAGRLIRPYVHAGLRPLTWAMSAAREPLTRNVTPYLGDIMLYLARGAAIRDEIARHVARLPAPVHVVAHSLGGIACLDLIAAGRLPQVQTLVSVGTQISYLYQIDALPLLARDAPVPALPDWFNVYDPHDLLSFPAEPAFGAGRVTDRRVRGGVPFPMSHSAYFRNDDFYRVLDEVLP